jgi:hypothetical protein
MAGDSAIAENMSLDEAADADEDVVDVPPVSASFADGPGRRMLQPICALLSSSGCCE